ncbi:MAG: LysR family transcriptional regulator [Oscillibacter sp.]|nr:LysR family transcriptional regulator [Oscillibacter sp.]
MKLQQLKYFVTACRLCSISRAAETLHISQPSVSMAIRELEREFGVSLIARRYQGFALTEEGIIFQDLAESLLRHADHISERMQALSQQQRPVRLGVPPMIGTVLLPSLYQILSLRYPELVLSTEELGTKALLRDLRENVLDVAFVSHDAPLPPEFDAVPIATMEIVWCAPRRHPLAALPAVSPVQLEYESLVVFQDSFSLRDLSMQQFENAGVTPRILHTTEQLSTVESLIRSGTATGFLLRPLAESIPDLAVLPLDPPVSLQVSLAWRKNQKVFRDMHRFIELCRRTSFF